MKKNKKTKGRLTHKRRKTKAPVTSQSAASEKNNDLPLTIQASDQLWDGNKKNLLFLSLGPRDRVMPTGFDREQWNLTFFDANKLMQLAEIEPNKYDWIWSINHLNCVYAHQVPVLIKQIHRILRPEGMVTLAVPNLAAVAEVIAGGKLEGELYKIQNHSITPIDLVYGNRKQIAAGNIQLAARTGFSPTTIGNKFLNSGFGRISIDALAMPHVIWLSAFKTNLENGEKPSIKISDIDVNEMMRNRDAIDKEPVIWNDYTG